MISLIVTADDLGSGPGRDRGIFRAFAHGIVTGASLLTNGPTFAAAAVEAKSRALPVGVHLNLSEGKALSGAIAGLTDTAGTFPGKEGLRRILAENGFDAKGLRLELAAQIDRLFSAGLAPDHLDTHQHFFLFPSVTETVLALAREYGIPALRLPRPAEDARRDPPPPLGKELALYRRLAPAAAATVNGSGLFTPQGLWGMPTLGRLDRKMLAAILDGVPEGIWELMVHPGFADPGHPFSGPARETELAALTAPETLDLVAARRIRLTTFGAAACAS